MQLLYTLEKCLLQVWSVDLQLGPAVEPCASRIIHVEGQFGIIFPAADGYVGGLEGDFFQGWG